MTTLIVKHLPEFITSTELKNKYFAPYNPVDVRFMQSQAMPGFVFLDFLDRSKAEAAFNQLKLINFGLYYKQITVEYAKPDPNRQSIPEAVKLTIEQHEQAAAPVSASQGILYPPNPHLRYFYPDPTPEILTNITNAIGTVPRFYTQVLHLMNKYNMPPPFGPHEKESFTSILKRKHDDLLASDESELEDEENDLSKETELQEKRVKQARLERIAAENQKLAIASTAATSNNPASSNSKNVTNKIKINIGKLTETQQLPTAEEASDKCTTTNPKLTEEQQKIRDNCITVTERGSFPIFKNYERGTPSNKLYLKNLGKHVTQKDLQDLYSSFSKDIQIDIMKKGRLRGQAFVTFPNEDIASLALDCTNGYMLHDRPITALFGKSGVVKE